MLGRGKSLCSYILALVAVLVLVAACGVPERQSGAGEERSGPDAGRSVLSKTAATEGTASPEATVTPEGSGHVVGTTPQSAGSGDQASENAGSEAGEASFIAAPETGGGSGLGADSILGVRFGDHGGYERVVLDLGTGDSPASRVPQWTLTSPAGDGLLRVRLPSVIVTGDTEGVFGGSLLKDYHVVRAPEGGMFVDIFARKAFYYRVIELSDPARLVVDFKPSGADLALPLPAEGANTVLVEPRRGASVGDPITVSGYSRNPEAVNTILLLDSGGDVVARRTVRSNDWLKTWGYFETTLDVPFFTGAGTLRVGTESARDGGFEGVEVPVRGS